MNFILTLQHAGNKRIFTEEKVLWQCGLGMVFKETVFVNTQHLRIPTNTVAWAVKITLYLNAPKIRLVD